MHYYNVYNYNASHTIYHFLNFCPSVVGEEQFCSSCFMPRKSSRTLPWWNRLQLCRSGQTFSTHAQSFRRRKDRRGIGIAIRHSQFSFFFFTALITRFFQLMSCHVIYRINISNVSNSLYLLFFHFSSYEWWWKWLDRKIFANLLGFLFLFEILTQLSFLINLYFFHVKFLPKSYVVTETGIK